jgi:rod shape-determining protein MreC
MSALLTGGAARRRTVAYVVLLTVSLLFVAISSNPLVRDLQNGIAFAFRPVQAAVDGVARDVSSILATIAEIDRLRLENEALRSENEHLRNENAQAKELQRQNDELVALLQLRTGLEFQTEPVSVIARESSEARRTVIVDRGADDGLEAGDVAVAAGGALVGRVAEVGPNFARVVLISDSTSTVVGQLLTSGATGKVVGQLGGALIMQDVDSLAQVVVGEEVFTAGIELGGGIRSPYPKGLLIGRVVDLVRDPNQVVQTVFLDAAANLDRLEYLLVITSYEGGLTGPLESLPPCEPTDGGTLPDSDQPCATLEPGG